MQRFLVDRHCIDRDGVVLEGGVVHQIRDVLRLRKGARVIVFIGDGWEHEVIIDRVAKNRVTGTISATRKCIEPGIKITLYQALLKADHFEFVLQKCTEIGVSEFVPITCERCVAGNPSANRIQRWGKVIKEAAEQSARSLSPVLKSAVSFEEACRSAKGLSIIASTGPESLRLKEIIHLMSRQGNPTNINIFIGPEGGFTPGELKLALRYGSKEIALGPHTLRAETAGLVAATVVLYEYGELDKSPASV
jgi:16S rRNA (uracil1498-N3)-methyltransferase